jgi:hypothetical protein
VSRIDHFKLVGHEAVPVSVETRDGLLEWAAWFETADRKVMVTELIDGGRISTFFLGLDHQWGKGPPILFETALFMGEKEFCHWLRREVRPSEVVARYSTWAEAEAGHMEWIERCVPSELIAATVRMKEQAA